MSVIIDIQNYIYNNQELVANSKATTLASILGVTTTDINRASIRMGYESFTDLKYYLKYVVLTKKIDKEEDREYHEICQLLINKRVFIFAKGSSKISAQYLRRFMNISGHYNSYCEDIHEMYHINKEDVMFIISRSGSTKTSLEAANLALKSHASIISMCPKNSELAKLSKFTLPIRAIDKHSSKYEEETQIDSIKHVDEIGKILLD